jgi:plasmid stabilization system protein ParE
MAGRLTALWSPEALADATSIWDFYADAAGTNTADRLLREIHRAVTIVEGHPMAGRSRDEVEPELRSIAAKPFVVFYRLRDQQPQIVRVLDMRRDIESAFAKPSAR